jgi:hypothetical protein
MTACKKAEEGADDPGKFTTFIAYEWTSLPGQANMHRNVIFRDDKAPKMPFTAMDSNKPEDLWTALEAWRKQGNPPHGGHMPLVPKKD